MGLGSLQKLVYSNAFVHSDRRSSDCARGLATCQALPECFWLSAALRLIAGDVSKLTEMAFISGAICNEGLHFLYNDCPALGCARTMLCYYHRGMFMLCIARTGQPLWRNVRDNGRCSITFAFWVHVYVLCLGVFSALYSCVHNQVPWWTNGLETHQRNVEVESIAAIFERQSDKGVSSRLGVFHTNHKVSATVHCWKNVGILLAGWYWADSKKFAPTHITIACAWCMRLYHLH